MLNYAFLMRDLRIACTLGDVTVVVWDGPGDLLGLGGGRHLKVSRKRTEQHRLGVGAGEKRAVGEGVEGAVV